MADQDVHMCECAEVQISGSSRGIKINIAFRLSTPAVFLNTLPHPENESQNPQIAADSQKSPNPESTP